MPSDQKDHTVSNGPGFHSHKVGEVTYQLPHFPYLRMRFSLLAQRDSHLPYFKGSLLRGAFGHALRRTVCVMGQQQPCETCLLRRQCAYPQLFETFVEGEPPPFLRGLDTAPRPYVFEPFDQQQHYRAGEPLRFDVLLFGKAIPLHPYAIYAVSQMASEGLGYKRFPFDVLKVEWQVIDGKQQREKSKAHEADDELEAASSASEWRLLYDGASKRLLENPTPQLVFEVTDHALSATRLQFQTPTRLKFNNTLTSEFSFRMLAFKMLRRVLELAHFYLPEANLNWSFGDLLAAANSVTISQRQLQWVDWERRSNRQNTEMKMGGFVGEIVLEGDLAPFSHLLRTCEIVHVGKGTVFGNGKIVCDFDPSVIPPRDESRG